ncbi:anti-sigma factor [Rhodococcus spelaei]|uniref:Regulator of SigK n=1 Tax=Rhodococcus spelaei TaxID=2546320 RepID=A0A541B0R4_9NOCA|nr:anti-sigma factor [Rhodococcus spelaei]TQF65917.1 anti-sigma factor [Rhodococcus spelaei]
MKDDQVHLAHGYALDALDEDDLRAAELILSGSDVRLRAEFESEVRSTRETLAATSSVTEAQPSADLRAGLLARIAAEPRATDRGRAAPEPPVSLSDRRVRTSRWRRVAVAAAAAVVVLAGGITVGAQFRTGPAPESTASQVMGAPDVRSSSTEVPGGGSATAMYSKQANAAVLVMNDVTPPPPDSVYQMWLVPGAGAPVSAGMMGPGQMSPSTMTVVDSLDDATLLAFTVEPAGGSPQPTAPAFASLALH